MADTAAGRIPLMAQTSHHVFEDCVGLSNHAEEIGFDLTWFPSHTEPRQELDPHEALRNTETWWTEWAAHCTVTGPWRDAAMRSLITLKALTYRPTGAIVAAPTTSLPERFGGAGADYRAYSLVAAEVGRYCGATALTWNMHVCSTLWSGGSRPPYDDESSYFCSMLTFAARITFAHFAISTFTIFSISDGGMPPASAPCSAQMRFKSGWFIAVTISRYMRCLIAAASVPSSNSTFSHASGLPGVCQSPPEPMTATRRSASHRSMISRVALPSW